MLNNHIQLLCLITKSYFPIFHASSPQHPHRPTLKWVGLATPTGPTHFPEHLDQIFKENHIITRLLCLVATYWINIPQLFLHTSSTILIFLTIQGIPLRSFAIVHASSRAVPLSSPLLLIDIHHDQFVKRISKRHSRLLALKRDCQTR